MRRRFLVLFMGRKNALQVCNARSAVSLPHITRVMMKIRGWFVSAADTFRERRLCSARNVDHLSFVSTCAISLET